MADLELLDSFRSTFDQAWGHLQWWASVSFGLLALTHFAAKKLNLTLVAFVSCLYGLFTTYILLNIGTLVAVGAGYMDDLRALQASGPISAASEALLSHATTYGLINGVIYQLCVAFTGIGTVFYLVYTYRANRREA